jgi:hypothetical protein
VDQGDREDHKEEQVVEVDKEPKVLLEDQVVEVDKEPKVLKEDKDSKELMDRQEDQVQQEDQVRQEDQDLKVPQVLKVRQEHKVQQDLLRYHVISLPSTFPTIVVPLRVISLLLRVFIRIMCLPVLLLPSIEAKAIVRTVFVISLGGLFMQRLVEVVFKWTLLVVMGHIRVLVQVIQI